MNAMRLTLVASIALCSAFASAQTGQPAVEKVTVRAVARFDFDRAQLREEDRAALLAEVAQLKNVTWQTVVAVGYTDDVGSDEYNQALAARRAEGVRQYLLSKGLEPTMVRTQALGEASPVADNATAEGRAQNRRTEVRFEGVRTAAR
jgi:OmpA-OmpF porin, OOP family